MDVATAGTTAALVAAIIALTKVLEWLMKKYSKTETYDTAKLEPEQTRQLREVHEKFIVIARDIEEMKKSSDRIADAMVKIADAVRKTSETNEKVASLVEKMDRRQEVEDEVRRRSVHE